MFDLRKLLFFLSLQFCCFAQVSFTDIPKDLQLFPRDTSNSAIVTVAGEVNWTDFKKISLYVKKDTEFFFHKAITLPDGYANLQFQFQTKIYALPVEYNFKVYLHNSVGDSMEVVSGSRERIVCGDFYVLYGQSNILGLPGIDDIYLEYDDRLVRNFDYEFGTINVGSLKWFPSKMPYAKVGGLGMQFQRLILQKYGIPTCIINGGLGGASIDELGNRTSGNPGDLGTTYGKLCSRVFHANAVGKVKGVLWRQGENESASYWVPITQYPAKFSQLYANMKSDFGGWVKLYNVQIGIYGRDLFGVEHYLEEAGFLRDYMRRTKYLFDDVETCTALGIRVIDDFHHSKESYEQLAREIFQMVERDIYNAPANPELHAPDIQKIYRSGKDSTLTLVFEEGQQMKFPADTTVNSVEWQMKNYFYLNCLTNSGCTPVVQHGWAEKNKIVLKLYAPADSGYLTYLPSFSRAFPPEQNIHLKNSKGLRAMSFYQFPVASILKKPLVDSVGYSSSNEVKVYFENSNLTIIERKINPDDEFTEIARVTYGYYIDRFSADSVEKVYYRIKKVSSSSESEYSMVKEHLLNDCHSSRLVLSGSINASASRKGLTVESSQKINASVKYYFKNSVELKSGFETVGNVIFEASSSGCND